MTVFVYISFKSIMGLNAGVLGEFNAALDALAEARGIGERTAESRLQCLANGTTGWIYTMQGAWDAGIEIGQHNLERSPDPVNTAIDLMFLGTAHVEKQQPRQAIPPLERAIQHFGRFHFPQGQGRCMSLLAEALLLNGALDQAQERALDGLRLSQDAGYLYGVGLAQRTLGLIAQAQGAWADALQHLHEALETFTNIEARYEIGRTYLRLAELAQAQGNQDALTANLSAAYHLFTTLHLPTFV